LVAAGAEGGEKRLIQLPKWKQGSPWHREMSSLEVSPRFAEGPQLLLQEPDCQKIFRGGLAGTAAITCRWKQHRPPEPCVQDNRKSLTYTVEGRKRRTGHIPCTDRLIWIRSEKGKPIRTANIRPHNPVRNLLLKPAQTFG